MARVRAAGRLSHHRTNLIEDFVSKLDELSDAEVDAFLGGDAALWVEP